MKHTLSGFPILIVLLMGVLFVSQAKAHNLKINIIYQNQISGHVTDSSGNSLSGVSIENKSTGKGTFTNQEGNFSIEAKAEDILVISYVGYITQEIKISNQARIDVTLLPTSSSLTDIVVIGYGTQKKSLVTGAIAQVTSKDLANKQITRLDDALRGKAAGVIVTQSNGAPGSSPNVYIRGITTINTTTPLYVIDGVVQTGNGGIDYLDPNDIASMEVLKDAASGAVYGTQAANGVIIVTTKKGALNTPMRINYSGQIGWQGPIKKVKMANATQYAELRNEAAINDGNQVPYTDPSIYGSGTNWQNEIFSNHAFYQNHNLSISGGGDKSTYYLSAGYRGTQGIIAPSIAYDKQFSLTTNTSFKLGKYVQVGENLSFTNQKNNTGMNTNSEYGGPLSDALNLDPITPLTVDSSFVAANPGTYPTAKIPYLIKAPNGMYYSISPLVQQEMTNPLAYLQTQVGNYGWSDNFVGNAYININPVKGLNLHSQINAKGGFWGSESFNPFYYLNTTNSHTAADSAQNSQYRDAEHNLTWNWDNTASYNRQIGLHTFEVMIGTSAMKVTAEGVNATHYGEPITNYQDASFGWDLPDSSKVGNGYENQVYTLNSYFGRLTYNYDERYLFMGIIRRDGSSKFGSNNRWGTFPSAQLGWVATREKFFPKNTPIDNLKIRVSYGVVGNDMSLSAFQYVSLIQGGGLRNYIFGNDGLAIGYSPAAPANPDLKWERTSSFDAGFDAVLLHNFTVTFDYYNKKTTGMLQTVQIPGFAGYLGQPWANVGNMSNKGVELDLGYNKNLGRDFRLNINGNISYNKNEVTYLGNGVDYLNGGAVYAGSTYQLTRMAVGHSVGSFFGFKELGTFKSQAEINSYGYTDGDGNFQLYQPDAKPGDFKWWKNPDNPDDGGKGTIGQGDRTFIGDAVPHWTYGININFSWKNWDLLAFGQGVWGNQIFQAYRRVDVGVGLAGGANYQVGALDAWTTLNPNSNYPRLTDNDPNHNFSNPSNFYLQSGAYFRLNTLQLGYTFPKSLLNAVKFQTLRIYASVTNLFTLTKYNGYDPEVGGNLGSAASGQNNGNYGVDYGIYPPARTFIIGLNVGL
ncbi:MAG: TonB-dependent receptor [Arachidicoccus sp.]|nr:TonB-dependent receptor [Arachidicoccus sp.]